MCEHIVVCSQILKNDYINIMRPRQQNCPRFADDTYKCIFFNEIYEFRLRLHWSLFLVFKLTISYHWPRQWLDLDQETSDYPNQWWLIDWRIYASLGLNELKQCNRFPYPDGVSIEGLWSVDGVHYFHKPECTLRCHSDLMEWYWSGTGMA